MHIYTHIYTYIHLCPLPVSPVSTLLNSLLLLLFHTAAQLFALCIVGNLPSVCCTNRKLRRWRTHIAHRGGGVGTIAANTLHFHCVFGICSQYCVLSSEVPLCLLSSNELSRVVLSWVGWSLVLFHCLF